jgi:hypothetical protein
MSDSEMPSELAKKRKERLDQRLIQVKRWAEYIEANPPDVWGEQLNTVVNSQLESARTAGEATIVSESVSTTNTPDGSLTDDRD